MTQLTTDDAIRTLIIAAGQVCEHLLELRHAQTSSDPESQACALVLESYLQRGRAIIRELREELVERVERERRRADAAASACDQQLAAAEAEIAALKQDLLLPVGPDRLIDIDGDVLTIGEVISQMRSAIATNAHDNRREASGS
jgi:hypothetical protein